MKKRIGFTGLFVLLPIAILVVFGYLGLSQKKRAEMAELEQKDIRTEIAQVRRLMAALQEQTMTDKYVAEPREEKEQANFLDSLRVYSRDAGVMLVLFIAQPPVIIPVDPEADAEQSISAVYQSVMSTVSVEGTFEQTREFAYSLMRSDRLLNMSQVKWERVNGEERIRLTMLVVRYITDILPEEPEEDSLPVGQIAENTAAGDGSES